MTLGWIIDASPIGPPPPPPTPFLTQLRLVRRCNFCKWQGAYTTSRAEEMGMGKTLQTISLILAGAESLYEPS